MCECNHRSNYCRCEGVPRYQVVDGSESGHCCYEATVIDTHKICQHLKRPDWVCECFCKARAHAIADAMNAADIAPLSPEDEEDMLPVPIYQDRCGKGWNIGSALLYYRESSDTFDMLIPNRIEFDLSTKQWMLDATTPYGQEHTVYGMAFKPHACLFALEATSDEVRNAL